ncbi:MAG: hypothetical protein Q9205_005855, partial [Flavoplaca limonia]
ELLAIFPNVKVILSVRDSDEQWWKSFNDTIGCQLGSLYPILVYPVGFLRRQQNIVFALKKRWGALTDSPIGPETFAAHKRLVKEAVPEKQLLEFNVKEGWPRLCEFLEVEVPEVPFPNLNDSKAIQKALFGAQVMGVSTAIWTSLNMKETPDGRTKKPTKVEVEDAVTSAKGKPAPAIPTNLGCNYDPVAWLHFRQVIMIVRKHRAPCNALRATLKRRMIVAQYRSYCHTKRGNIIASQPYDCYASAVEDVRVKVDTCLDRVQFVQNRIAILFNDIKSRHPITMATLNTDQLSDDKVPYERFGDGLINSSDVKKAQDAVGEIAGDGLRDWGGDKRAKGPRVLSEILSRLRDAKWVEEASR